MPEVCLFSCVHACWLEARIRTSRVDAAGGNFGFQRANSNWPCGAWILRPAAIPAFPANLRVPCTLRPVSLVGTSASRAPAPGRKEHGMAEIGAPVVADHARLDVMKREVRAWADAQNVCQGRGACGGLRR